VGTVTKRLAHQFAEKKVLLKVLGGQENSLSTDLPLVLADEDRITQVLMNLIANAMAYTPPGGIVTVSAQVTGRELQLSIKDNGAGIPAASLTHIFDRFYRVDKSRSRAAGGGSGIGLTIARAFIEAHGGRIWAESGGEGQGSTFSFTLPLSK
jgi:two-component system sensor histidine kinase BaeS